LAATAFKVAHHAGQDHLPSLIGQALGQAVAHRSHQRMGGSQVYAYANAAGMRIGRLTGLGDLQKGHA
jgi:hypothetical protein